MARVVVLGGAGGIGTAAVRALAAVDDFAEIVVADQRADAAAQVCAAIGDDRCIPAAFDAADQQAVRALLDGTAVAVGCVGPFYRFGPPLLRAAIATGVDYVDVCDDLDPTITMLALDADARAAGVTAVVGLGNSPGLANVFVRMCAEGLLDEVHAVDILHVHGGEPDEGPAVVHHRIHAMRSEVPVFDGGEMHHVRMLEPSGDAYVVETDFRDVGRFPVFPYPHPETITLPRSFPHLRRVTNRGVVFPLSYFELTQRLVREGFDADEVVRQVLAERPRLLADAGVTGPAGCLKVVVEGVHAGEPHTYVLSLSATDRGAGEGTGIPAALGAVLVHRGLIEQPGVHPPEAVVPVGELLSLAGQVIPAFGMTGGFPLHVEHLGPDGTIEELPLGL